MRLHHGSNVAVERPELLPLARALDFGRLLTQRLRDQYAFKTEKALSCLVFREAVGV